MNDLARHIEALLVDNDCVIVPGVGGFIIHYSPARWVEEKQAFFPPTRMTGFNSRLKVNDGLLVQSYMSAHHTDFSKASKLLEKDIDELLSALHRDGKVSLDNIGQLTLSVHDMLGFTPCTNKSCTPALFGWDNLPMSPLKAQASTTRLPSLQSAEPQTERQRFKIPADASFWSNVAAVVAIIVLCLALSIPVENTEVVKGNYAQLLPTDAFQQMGNQSLTITPLAVKEAKAPKKESQTSPEETPSTTETKLETDTKKAPETLKAIPRQKAEPVKPAPQVKETPKSEPLTTCAYHIIVASVGTAKDARNMAQALVAKGFKNAKAIIGDGKMRVCLDSYATEGEAYRALEHYRENKVYENAWILKKKQ